MTANVIVFNIGTAMRHRESYTRVTSSKIITKREKQFIFTHTDHDKEGKEKEKAETLSGKDKRSSAVAQLLIEELFLTMPRLIDKGAMPQATSLL